MSSVEISGTGVSSRPEILRVDGLWKRFGRVEVLRGISFALRQGEILGVIGPSGGGKTTLLRCLDLLESVDQGQISYHGPHYLTVASDGTRGLRISGKADNGELSEKAINALRQDIGFVFQGFNLWEERTVLGNLVLAPTVVLGQSRGDAVGRARELCEQFGLGDKIEAKVTQLSGGQRQRVAIIRALMMQPKVMLLDEITSALDPVLTVEVMQAIRQLRDKGLTMIVVTHHLEFASSLCDRIMFLSRGEAVQVDTPDSLRASPASPEVKRFLEVLRDAR
jgi:ABC-type polar amino acid transport system ATPase subunit